MHAYIWSCRVKREWRERFRDAYGPSGEWAKFFAKSEGYIRSDLLNDEKDAGRFVTIDYFQDAEARGELVAKFGAEYKAIDARWQDATLEETFIGAFRRRFKRVVAVGCIKPKARCTG
jgi:hypothetical protein